MSELAYNINGEGFEPPETATGWRVRRMKARGAPEVVYKDGLPLVIPIESDLEELRRTVDAAGRFRLDPVDDRGRNVEGAQPAYVVVPHKVEERRRRWPRQHRCRRSSRARTTRSSRRCGSTPSSRGR